MMSPVLAPPLAAVMDVGPRGVPRLTAFPVALAVLDPSLWECAWNSLAMAAAVTSGSLVLGAGIGGLLAPRSFWGRRPLEWLACAGMAVPPAFGAIGLRWAFGPSGWFRPASEVAWSPLEGNGAWLGWFWVALVASAPVVGIAMTSATRKLDPAWKDAGRWAGASRRQVWRQLLWPVARPEVARSLAAVFTLTLLDPGPAIVLGLRRTLGFQVVRSAMAGSAPGELTRAAVLATLGILLSILGRLLVGWWGGKALESPGWRVEPFQRIRQAPWAVASACCVLLLGLILLAWLPSLALLGASLADGTFLVYREVWVDPSTRGTLIRSGTLGLVVLALNLTLARLVVGASGALGARRVRVPGWAEAVPPLAVGVGALVLPSLLLIAASSSGSGLLGWFSPRIESLAGFLDPDQTPGVALLLAVAAVRFPMLAQSVQESRSRTTPSSVEAALTFGASPRVAQRWNPEGWLGASPGALALTFSLAATSVTPALVLCPSAETRTVGPAVLLLADGTDESLRRASAMAALAVVLNLAALSLSASPENFRRGSRRPRLPSKGPTD